jgi:hypothetical protein
LLLLLLPLPLRPSLLLRVQCPLRCCCVRCLLPLAGCVGVCLLLLLLPLLLLLLLLLLGHWLLTAGISCTAAVCWVAVLRHLRKPDNWLAAAPRLCLLLRLQPHQHVH